MSNTKTTSLTTEDLRVIDTALTHRRLDCARERDKAAKADDLEATRYWAREYQLAKHVNIAVRNLLEQVTA